MNFQITNKTIHSDLIVSLAEVKKKLRCYYK